MQSTTEDRVNVTARARESVKALAVIPGKPGTIHLREVPKPNVDDIRAGKGVLIKMLRVGVDGTDKEINAAEYGAAPADDVAPPADIPLARWKVTTASSRR